MTRRSNRPRSGADRSPIPGAITTRNGKRWVFDLAADGFVAVNPIDETVGKPDDRKKLSPGQLPKDVSEHIYGPDEDLDDEQKR